MKNKIFMRMTFLVSAVTFCLSIILCVVFYNQFADNIKGELGEKARIFSKDNSLSAFERIKSLPSDNTRISIILGDGTVFFDNMADAETLENHSNRIEVKEALLIGESSSSRFSETLGLETYYHAIRLTDDSVMRMSKTINSIWGVFTGVLPLILIITIVFITIGYFVSLKLARKIVEPIDEVDFSGNIVAPYEEFVPFVRAIEKHKKQSVEDSLELERQTRTISSIMDDMDEGLLLLDKNGVILSINKSALDIFNVSGPLKGRNVLELIRNAEFFKKIEKALDGKKNEMTLKQNDRIFRIIISSTSDIGVIVFFLDITERVRLEEKRQEFSANVSHELKTPLTSIYGFSEMLVNGVVKESDKNGFYQKIMNEASRLIVLIDDIITLSELDEVKSKDNFEKLNLNFIARECKEALHDLAKEKDIDIIVEGDAILMGNYSMLYEMFYNIIHNGIKYNKFAGEVRVKIVQDDEKIKISISDDGVGIPESEKNSIFERFYRVDKSRFKRSGGTGLGLAIVKHIVMIHGGTIKVFSKQKEGSTFEITFDIE